MRLRLFDYPEGARTPTKQKKARNVGPLAVPDNVVLMQRASETGWLSVQQSPRPWPAEITLTIFDFDSDDVSARHSLNAIGTPEHRRRDGAAGREPWNPQRGATGRPLPGRVHRQLRTRLAPRSGQRRRACRGWVASTIEFIFEICRWHDGSLSKH